MKRPRFESNTFNPQCFTGREYVWWRRGRDFELGFEELSRQHQSAQDLRPLQVAENALEELIDTPVSSSSSLSSLRSPIIIFCPHCEEEIDVAEHIVVKKKYRSRQRDIFEFFPPRRPRIF